MEANETMDGNELNISNENLLKFCSVSKQKLASALLHISTTVWVPHSEPLIFKKLWKARSRLYRRRFSRPNTRWKPLDENYKFHALLVTLTLNF